jgi:hypothetical protein
MQRLGLFVICTAVWGSLGGLCGLCCRAFPEGLPPSSLLWEQHEFHDVLPICCESAGRSPALPFGRASSARQRIPPWRSLTCLQRAPPWRRTIGEDDPTRRLSGRRLFCEAWSALRTSGTGGPREGRMPKKIQVT